MNFVEGVEKIQPYVSNLWILIIGAAVWACFYINIQKRKGNLMTKKRWIETIPNVISTLGVLGTFLGISLGLICFDSDDISKSIPKLLDGLKTAFFTSLAGMTGSLILSRRINKLYDKESGGISDVTQATTQICQAVSALQAASMQQSAYQQVFYNLMQTVVQKMNTTISSICTNINSLNIASNNIALTLQNMSKDLLVNSQNTKHLLDNNEKIIKSLNNIEELSGNQLKVATSQASITDESNNRLGVIADFAGTLTDTEGKVHDKVTNLKDQLHEEVIDIESKMTQTNALLTQKFDEFSELLKKNNTEALVEVMKRVTVEFQKQMNALVSKLVQENFEQLNKSVEQLNKWQIENRSMIQSLTSQYKQMADNFEGTSNSLDRVKADTKALVSDGGKLDKLVNSLNEVIVKDEKFKAISADLLKIADLSKSNMESFDGSTRVLNDWIKKQRNFSDAVSVLIKKLDEINEIRNYASTFWNETKKGMNESVGIIQSGSKSLNKQLEALDQQFYARLSTTLAQLDACIQSFIKK